MSLLNRNVSNCTTYAYYSHAVVCHVVGRHYHRVVPSICESIRRGHRTGQYKLIIMAVPVTGRSTGCVYHVFCVSLCGHSNLEYKSLSGSAISEKISNIF